MPEIRVGFLVKDRHTGTKNRQGIICVSSVTLLYDATACAASYVCLWRLNYGRFLAATRNFDTLANYCGSCVCRIDGLSRAGGGVLCGSLIILAESILEWRGIPSLGYRGICRSFDCMIKMLRAS